MNCSHLENPIAKTPDGYPGQIHYQSVTQFLCKNERNRNLDPTFNPIVSFSRFSFKDSLSLSNSLVILFVQFYSTDQLVPRFHRDRRKRAKRGWERRDKRPRAGTEVHRGRRTLEASNGLIALAAATTPPFWRSTADLWSSYLPISIQRCTEAWQRLPRRFDEAPRACPKRGPTNPWKRRWNLRQRFRRYTPIILSELDRKWPVRVDFF